MPSSGAAIRHLPIVSHAGCLLAVFAGTTAGKPDTHEPVTGCAVNRDRVYFILMGVCIGAVVLAWTVVRLFSVTAAVVISVAVGLIPPIAAIIANAGDEGSRRR